MTNRIPDAVIPELVEWLMSDEKYPYTNSLGTGHVPIHEAFEHLGRGYDPGEEGLRSFLTAALYEFNEHNREVPERVTVDYLPAVGNELMNSMIDRDHYQHQRVDRQQDNENMQQEVVKANEEEHI